MSIYSTFHAVLVLTFGSAQLALAVTPAASDSNSSGVHVAAVRIDSSHHTLVLRTGPWDVPRTVLGYNEMVHDANTEPAQQTFTWPVTGWVRGVKLRVLASDGSEISRGLIHHLNVVNFGRRQLFYAIPERLMAIGRETEDIKLPASVGVPVTAGMPMAINFAWFNDGAEELRNVAIEVTVDWSPSNTMPRPVSVLPVHMGVVNPVASDPSFDLPAGASTWSAEYTLPLNGRIIAAGGHQHDFGTGKELVKGAMAHLALLFAPARMEDWPAIDAENPDWKRDVASLIKVQPGEASMAGMAGMSHEQ